MLVHETALLCKTFQELFPWRSSWQSAGYMGLLECSMFSSFEVIDLMIILMTMDMLACSY